MYEKLMALMKKPDLNNPDAVISNYSLWSDEHISKGMLKSHLNPDEEGATCRHEFVFNSVTLQQYVKTGTFNLTKFLW